MSDHHHDDAERWKHDGIRVIKDDHLDPATAQTPGMFRQVAIETRRSACGYSLPERRVRL